MLIGLCNLKPTLEIIKFETNSHCQQRVDNKWLNLIKKSIYCKTKIIPIDSSTFLFGLLNEFNINNKTI